MQRVVIFILLGIIVLMLFSGLFFFYEIRFMSSRASGVSTDFSESNTFISRVKGSARADGLERARYMLYVLSDNGIGVFDKEVSVTNPNPESIIITQSAKKTPADGLIMIDIASRTAGVFDFEVVIAGKVISKKIHAEFE